MSAGIKFREDKYGVNLLKALNQLRKEQKWSDFVIETKSGLVPVHRVVLAAAQNLHLQSLCFPLGEVSSFNLDNYSKNTVEIFVSYLYTGEISVDSKVQINELLELCKSLKFTSLLNRKEFQQYIDKIDKNNDELSNTHDDSIRSENESPHPIFLTESQNGTVIVKQISEPSVTNEKSDMYLTSDKPITDPSHVSSTELDDSVIHQICIKQEMLESDDKSDNGQPLDDDMSESDKSVSTPTTSINDQKRTRGQHVTKTKRAKLDDTVENYAKKLVSSALGSSEDGSEEDESQPMETESEMKEEVPSENDKVIMVILNVSSGDKTETQKDNSLKGKSKDKSKSSSKTLKRTKDNKLEESSKKHDIIRVPHSCKLCRYVTYSKGNYNKHIKRHTNPSSSYYQSSASDNNSENTKTVGGNVGHVCEKCGKTFRSKFGFTLHNNNKHMLEFKHKCEFCVQGFNQFIQYRFHCAAHQNIQPDVCSFCGTGFTSHGSLKRHLKTCSNIDKSTFVCDICQACFTSKDRLTDHIKGKHEEPRYGCVVCGKKLKWRSSLKAHMKYSHPNIDMNKMQILPCT